MYPSQVAELLSKVIPSRLPILLQGSPGVGKTDLIGQAGEMCGAEVYYEFPAISDATDGKGVPFAGNGDNTAHWLQFERHKIYCTTNKLTVISLEDLGQAGSSVQASFMPWILARRIGDNKISDNVCIIASTNRRSDKAGVSGLLEPVKSRFATIIELEPNLEDWIKWALSHDIPTELIAFIRWRPHLLFDFKPTNDLTNSPCPRTVANVGRLMKCGIPQGLEFETIKGTAGETFATEFVGFLRTFRSMPNLDLIMMNPDKAEVPTDPAVLYALSGALSRQATDQTIERLVTYFNRMPAEFSVLAMKDASTNNPDIINTRAFIQWRSDHQDVLF